ncbi:tetratricopeptide repeat family protein [Janthinobacterium agaricidamnosum NBRC 102515 = DSM 9628]|uniref:Tetratricopeptide repeat family protein n=1 Tax=Janthinobacterium agaricidamnosum NBRC 102515 = DSM 9628 TaxID=1349767 RepID=W0VAE1_9BURK|nr:tetratricopeptide repeat family protein [Janthinobacterium agaricidamnosum NBRC 102515 = DSM 9628]
MLSGQYQIRRRLGEGGFGEVFEAWDTQLRRNVALKQLKPMTAASGADLLLAEARLAASLKHSAFVKIFAIDDVGDDGAQSIIMELVEGDTLGQFGAIRAVSHAQALDIAAQVAEAMYQAHQAKLVHGDIKPSNLMLEASGKVRILDFGLARQIDRQSAETVLLGGADTHGTVAYLAPERLLGKPSSPLSDIYSLGAVLYELLAGERPFAELNGLALAAAHLNSSSASWPVPDGGDAAVIALVRSMTAKDPDLRPPSMQAVGKAIRAITHPDASVRIELAPDSIAAAAALPAARRFGLRTVWLGLALVVPLLTLGAWQAGLPAQIGQPAQPPYSEAAAMRDGLEALRVSDRDGSLDQAIAAFDSILARQPAHAAAAAGLSLAYSLRYYGDRLDETWLQRADASAQQALLYDDQLALAYVAQAWVRESQGSYDEALAITEKALALDPLNLFALFGKVDLLTRMRRYDAAEQSIAQAMRAYPKERQFSDSLGKLRYLQNNYAAAEQAFRRSIALEPDAVYAYANLNQALLRQDRSDEALQVLQQGLQIRPNSRLYGNLGTALFARGNYHGAAEAFEHAVSASQGNPNLYLNWANLADTLRWIPGREAASRHAYQQAADLLEPRLRRAPSDITFKSRMGLYRAKLGQRKAALAWTLDALHSDAASADVRFRAAVAYAVSNELEKAVTQLIQARKLGYPANLIDSEPDLMTVRRDARYHLPPPPPKKAQDEQT